VHRIRSTHTFSSDRGIRIVGVVALAVMIVIVCAVTIAHGTQGGFNVWVKIAFIAIFGVPSAWFAVRWLRLGVEISSGKMTVRNLWRTRVIGIGEICGIVLAVKSGHPGTGDRWVPRVDLTNADSIWIEGFECGFAASPPYPERAAAFDELRSLLGFPPPSSSNDQ